MPKNPIAVRFVSWSVARRATNDIENLWQAQTIIDLAIATIGDERAEGKLPIKPALRAASDVIHNSIGSLVLAAE